MAQLRVTSGSCLRARLSIVRYIVDLPVALIKMRNAESRRVLRATYTILTVQTYVLGCMVAKVLSFSSVE
jgi:hypothetical protein